jgi:ABC-type transport system involved in multi-copper enzyme maturation permease subunit
MTTTLASPALTAAGATHASPARLIRAEIMKIRTTNTWWLFGIGIVLVTALALTSNGFEHHFELYPALGGMPADEQARALADAAQARTHAGLAAIAADMVTSGQFFGVLFSMLIGVLVVTNEFFHQTATATFMTNPHRTTVIMAKLAAAVTFGVLFWLISTVLDLATTAIYLNTQHVSISLGDWIVVRSILLNLLAYAMWAIFGLGLGTLVRSQIGSVVTGMAVYLIGLAAVAVIFRLIYNFYHHDWVLQATVIAPAVASAIMTTPGRLDDHAAPQWLGLLVMIGYSIVLGGIGIMLTRRRDIS